MIDNHDYTAESSQADSHMSAADNAFAKAAQNKNVASFLFTHFTKTYCHCALFLIFSQPSSQLYTQPFQGDTTRRRP